LTAARSPGRSGSRLSAPQLVPQARAIAVAMQVLATIVGEVADEKVVVLVHGVPP
jgi:hypothetical protein